MPDVANSPRLDPKALFTGPEWARLTRRSAWLGIGLVAHAWAVIAAAMALFALFPNPLTWLLAVMLIGARQLGLAILMHDAAHRALHPDAAVNDFLGQWLCAAPVGASLSAYRPYHLAHHRFVQTENDPDLALSAPFPVTRASLLRKAFRDLTGQTFVKQRFGALIAAFSGKKRARNAARNVVADDPRRAFGGFVLANLGLLAGLAAFGRAELLLLLWLPAMATWFPFVTRLRNIGEHACAPDDRDPLRNARTVLAGPLERLFIAPYWVHYHVEHHLFMYLPCYRLAAAHDLLIAKGYGPLMEIEPSYAAVLALATRAKAMA